MAELRSALQALVDRPPVVPAEVDVVAARSVRFARRRRAWRVAAGAAVAMASAIGLSVAGQDEERGLELATAGPTSAGYIAERPGGYVATGTWHLTITRGNEVIELVSQASAPCGPVGVIQPGDEVRGSIAGPESSLRVGERFACQDDRE